MHLKNIAQKFNINNFFIYCCLLLLSVLISLRVDGVVFWSFGILFLPLWVWKTLTVVATVTGVAIWIKKKKLRKELEHRKNFIVMILSAVLQFVIFVEEILIALNLDRSDQFSWSAIFTPLYVLCIMSVTACILSSCLRKCNVELEVLGFINILQLVFLGIRLDGVVMWRWAVVLIPTWILLILTCVYIVFYGCLQCCLISAAENQQEKELRKPLVAATIISLSSSTVSFIVFLALLVSQLDGNLSAPFTATFVPLHISILCLLPTTFSRQPANPLWFGLQKNLLEVVLELCPLFKEYLNVSWSKNAEEVEQLPEIVVIKSRKIDASSTTSDKKTYLYEDIMTPD